jgi:hypothetical protein
MTALEEQQFRADLCADFVYFVECLWTETGLNRYQPLGEVEFQLAHWLAYGQVRPEEHNNDFPVHWEGKPTLRGLLAPRGVGKSTLACALKAWHLLRDHQRRVRSFSKSLEAAKGFALQVRMWLESVWFLRHLKPGKIRRGGRKIDNAIKFFVKGATMGKDASVTAMGVDGQKHGGRGHLIVGDDIETPENTQSPEAQIKLHRMTVEFINMQYPQDPSCEAVVIGTYEAPDPQQSVYTKLAQEGYAFVTFPILYPQPHEHVLNLHPYLKHRLESGLAQPGDKVFPWMADSEVKKRQTNPMSWSKEHMLLTRLKASDHYPFVLQDLIIPSFPIDKEKAPIDIRWGRQRPDGSDTTREDILCLGMQGDCLRFEASYSPHFEPYDRQHAWLDTAGGKTATSRNTSDRTSLGIAGLLNARIFVRHLAHVGPPNSSAATPENILHIATTLRDHKVPLLYVESSMLYDAQSDPYGQLVQQAIDKLAAQTTNWSCRVIATKGFAKRAGYKESRIIDALQPVVPSHRLVIDASIVEPGETKQATIQYQLTNIRMMKGALPIDDLVETLASLCWAFGDPFSSDPDHAADEQLHHAAYESLDRAGAIRLERPEPQPYRQRMSASQLPSFNQR